MRPIRSTLAVLAAGGLLAWWAYPSAADQTAAAAAPVAPGPAVLNAPAPTAPQLENTGVWQAKPTMICHTSAYRAGEFLNQGCVYDDQGAQLVTTNWPEHSLTFAYTYPTDPAYRANAADLVEVRVKPLADATAFRITFNTMTDPELVGTTIALGNSLLPRQAPYGANTSMPAEKFVTVHGRTGDIVDAATGQKSPVTGGGRPRTPSGRGPRPAHGVQPRHPQRPGRRGRRPVGPHGQQVPAAAGRGRRHPPGRRAHVRLDCRSRRTSTSPSAPRAVQLAVAQRQPEDGAGERQHQPVLRNVDFAKLAAER